MPNAGDYVSSVAWSADGAYLAVRVCVCLLQAVMPDKLALGLMAHNKWIWGSHLSSPVPALRPEISRVETVCFGHLHLQRGLRVPPFHTDDCLPFCLIGQPSLLPDCSPPIAQQAATTLLHSSSLLPHF